MSTPRGRVAAVLGAFGLIAVSATGCGPFGDDRETSPAPASPNGTASPSGVPRALSTPEPSDVDFTSPRSVCAAFTDTLLSGSPATEGQLEPIQRASRYVTDGYQETFLRQAPRLGHWEDWSDAGADRLKHTRIRYVGDEPNKGTRNRQYRLASRRVVPTDSHGDPLGRTYGFVVYCTLVSEEDRWLVDDHNQEEIDPGP